MSLWSKLLVIVLVLMLGGSCDASGASYRSLPTLPARPLALARCLFATQGPRIRHTWPARQRCLTRNPTPSAGTKRCCAAPVWIAGSGRGASVTGVSRRTEFRANAGCLCRKPPFAPSAMLNGDAAISAATCYGAFLLPGDDVSPALGFEPRIASGDTESLGWEGAGNTQRSGLHERPCLRVPYA